jgi:hypothetical protein
MRTFNIFAVNGACDTRENRLRMRANQNVFLEFKRVLVWKEMLVISEYTNNFVGISTFVGQRYCINEDMKEWALSFKNWL